MTYLNIGKIPYYGERELLVDDKNQEVAEIITAITNEHDLDKTDYDLFSEKFWKGNAKDTGKALFDYLKKNVTYLAETPEDQTVKTPGVLLNHGYGDCKHYALFICGVCDSLNAKGYPIEAFFRFVADYPGMEVHHVFAVIKDRSGEWWCDPVIKYFNERPTFYNIKDKKMAISRLSGTSDKTDGTISANVAIVAGLEMMENRPELVVMYLNKKGKNASEFKNVEDLKKFIVESLQRDISQYAQGGEIHNRQSVGKKHAKKAGHKNFLKSIEHGFKVNAENIKHGIEVNAANAKMMALKVSLSAARGPFLSLVDMNAFNIAHHLRDTLMAPGGDRNGLLSEWKKIGGNDRALINAVNNGYREYKRHAGHGGWNQATDRVNGTINGPEIAAWLALASGIIAALSKFIKSTPAEKAAMAKNATAGITSLAGAADAMNNLEDAVDNGDPAAIQAVADQAAGNNPLNANNGAMSISTGVDQDGTPVMQVSAVSSPANATAGQPTSANSDPDAVPGGGATPPETGGAPSSGDGSSIPDTPPAPTATDSTPTAPAATDSTPTATDSTPTATDSTSTPPDNSITVTAPKKGKGANEASMLPGGAGVESFIKKAEDFIKAHKTGVFAILGIIAAVKYGPQLIKKGRRRR